MTRPRLLDAFCGAGGSARGYADAGFDVTGLDNRPQPRYPYRFILGDALEYIRDHGREYDAVHASPPCQAYSRLARMGFDTSKHPRLIEPVRALLHATGRPYAIENVEGAPLLASVTLCGTMFGLSVRLHRLFELGGVGLLLTPSCACRNGVQRGRLIGTRLRGPKPRNSGRPPEFKEYERRAALGVPWMSIAESHEAIPPAYTRFIGAALLSAIGEGGRCLAG